MKGISESIIVLAGSIAILGGALAERRQSEFPIALGVILIIIGMIGWIMARNAPKD